MKRKPLNSSKSNSIEGQFKSLNNTEMDNLKGGTNPPLPPSGGDDYPILLGQSKISTTSTSVQPLPEL